MKSNSILIIGIIGICSGIAMAQTNYTWGFPGTEGLPGDYNGDGHTDLAVYQEASGAWYIYSPYQNSVLAWDLQWGFDGGMPVVRDFDGDGADDLGVYDQAEGNWYVYSPAKQATIVWDQNWGWSQAVPVPEDYDGDGVADMAVYCPDDGSWYIYTPPQQEITDPDEIWSIYTNAVAWAAMPRQPADISKTLTSITTNNTSLEWRIHPESSALQVKVASLMTSYVATNFYHAGQPTTLPTNGTSWVTAVPDLKTALQQYGGTNMPLRARQMLGLHPSNNNDTVVEFWIDPSYLVRPSPDPEITDHEAELDMTYTNNPFVSLSPVYVSWFTNQVVEKYESSWPYPWTRAGYTYDWGGSTNDIVGLSEFIVPAELLNNMSGRTVTVDVTLVTNVVFYP